MATVYLATDRKLGRPVALKVLKPELAHALGPERFLREIEISARLHHPHILPLHDSGEADGFLYYTMPFVEGESLRDRLDREKQLPIEDAVQIAREVADALSYAHSRDVLHRDIKPENILLQSGHATVADFGIARAISAAGGDRITETGLTIGTPSYMSPEQAAGEKELDGRSDLYSLGCVFFEMLAGQPPFTGATVESVIQQHLAADPPTVSNIRPAVPTGTALVVSRALAKTPADRFKSVAVFAEALHGPGPSPRRWFLPAIAASVLVTVLAGGIVALSNRPASDPADDEPPPFTIVAAVEGSAALDVRQAVQTLVGVRLDQSKVLRSVPRRDLVRALELAGLPDTAWLDESRARELAVRGAVNTIVVPVLDRLGSTFALSVSVVQPNGSVTLAAESREADDEADLPSAVTHVIDAIRERLGERRDEIGQSRPLRQVATPSFDAFNRYAQALNHYPADYAGCVREGTAAVALDSAFATAWALIGVCYGNDGKVDAALQALKRALTHPQRLLDAERHDVEGLVAVYEGEGVAALRAYERVFRVDPGRGNQRRAVVLAEMLGRYDDALQWSERDRALAPFGPHPLNFILAFEILVALGRLEEADSLSRYLTTPPRLNAYASISLAGVRHDWAELERLGLLYASDPLIHPVISSLGQRSLVATHVARGRFATALQTLSQPVGRSRSDVAMQTERFHWWLSLVTDPPRDRATHTDTSRARVIWSGIRAAQDGDSAQAVALLDGAGVTTRWGDGWVWSLALALIDLRRGRFAAAVESLATSGDKYGQIERWWLLADAYEQMGQPDSAAAYLHRIAAGAGVYEWDNIVAAAMLYPFVHQRLGQLYGKAGRPHRAQEHYLTFLETFTQPDPEYVWMREEAQRALEELARGR